MMDRRTDGRTYWTGPDLPCRRVVGRVHLQIRRRRCPWRNKTFVRLLKDGNFDVRRGFCLLPKGMELYVRTIFFCLLWNGSNSFFYFHFNVHAQFLFFLVCLLWTGIISKLKNRVFWRTKQLKSLRGNLILVSVGEINWKSNWNRSTIEINGWKFWGVLGWATVWLCSGQSLLATCCSQPIRFIIESVGWWIGPTYPLLFIKSAKS